jgi:hypothetical protein
MADSQLPIEVFNTEYGRIIAGFEFVFGAEGKKSHNNGYS